MPLKPVAEYGRFMDYIIFNAVIQYNEAKIINNETCF